MNNRKLLLIGGGGHCKSIIDVLEESEPVYSEIGIIDIHNIGKKVMDYIVLGNDDDLQKLLKEGYTDAFISLGGIGNGAIRENHFLRIKSMGFNIPNIVSSTATVSRNVVLGDGIFIGKKAVVNVGVTIGNNSIINTVAIVEHDCQIDSSVHISPGSVLSGGVTIGNYSHLGTNACVVQNIQIGKNVIVGAGSVVNKSLNNNIIAYGVPCREIKQR